MIFEVSHAGWRIFLLALVLTSSGCRNTVSQMTIVNPATAFAPTQEPLIIPTDTSQILFTGLMQKASVANYYRTYGTVPIWIEGDGYSVRGDSMLSIIHKTQYYGLPSEYYHFTELENLSRNSSHAITIRKELLLTDVFLSLAADLKFGLQKLKQKESEDSLRIKLLNKVVLNGFLVRNLEWQEPSASGYKLLKAGLRAILDSAAKYDADSVSLSKKIRLISINLERWRRETSTLSGRYIFVNIPSFMLNVVDHDSTVLSSKVIVGTPDKETPLLSSVVECFSIYPYWHVPRKISIEEYLPILKKDTTFLRRNNFDVLDRKGNMLNPDSVAWSKFNENYFPVVLRQREGTENSLGVIKFIFDNPYAVFLHDTNAKRLFRNTSRALSHGCIRMEKAVELAHYLVTESVGVESKTISKYLKEKQQRWIDLKKPVPIYTRYFTCEFKNGLLYIYKDIYSMDRPLYHLLYKDQGEVDL